MALCECDLNRRNSNFRRLYVVGESRNTNGNERKKTNDGKLSPSKSRNRQWEKGLICLVLEGLSLEACSVRDLEGGTIELRPLKAAIVNDAVDAVVCECMSSMVGS